MKTAFTKVQIAANKAAMFCKRPIMAYRTWQFSEGRLLNYYLKKGIHPHTRYMSNEQFLKPLLNTMGINTIDDAKKLVRSLKKLGIKEIFVEHDVDLGKNVIEKMRLWHYLEKFIDQKQTLEKMIIRRRSLPKCSIDDKKCLFISQIESSDHATHEGGLEGLLLNLKMAQR
jgi:hypothetical protein